MSWLGRLKRSLVARRRGEQDAPATNAGPRKTGGGSDVETQDQHSTTGTTEREEYVGRAGGDESGDTGKSGAEARGERRGDLGGGAARDT